MDETFWFSDMACEHLLKQNGRWLKLPLDGDDHLMLLTIRGYQNAMHVAGLLLALDRHVKLFRAPDGTHEEYKQ